MLIVLVCGGRRYSNRKKVFKELDAIHSKTPIALIKQGGATGADALAKAWAVKRKIDCLELPADWGKYGLSAGKIRNRVMLEAPKPDLVVAFKGSNGTKDMVNAAIAADVDVLKFF